MTDQRFHLLIILPNDDWQVQPAPSDHMYQEGDRPKTEAVTRLFH